MRGFCLEEELIIVQPLPQFVVAVVKEPKLKKSISYNHSFVNICKKINPAIMESMALQLFNTLSRKKEEFKPIHGKKIGLYTCGPTVYNFAHIGNLRTYIFEDVLKRVLKYNHYMIKHVMNVTDVGHLTSDADEGEDKIESAAKEQKKTAGQITNFYFKIFKSDIRKLNIKSPNIYCKATDHIKEQIDFIKGLEEKGFVYKTSDGIYFDTAKLSDYGKLAKLDIEGLKAGARVEASVEKKNPTDFALWKFSPKDKKRQQEWRSPWGVGFPGWHIECSAMSQRYLGKTFDIHCGAIDLMPVHHTNEIAQSEALNGVPPANYWMHGEFLDFGDEKMSKSKGGFITLADLINPPTFPPGTNPHGKDLKSPFISATRPQGISEGVGIKKQYNPLAYRYLTFTAHYRTKLNFSFEALDAAQNALNNIYQEISTWERPSKGAPQYEEFFFEAVSDDLNLPAALAVLHNMINDNTISTAQKKRSILKFDDILGLDFKKIRKQNIRVPKHIQKLVAKRQTLRAAQKYSEADLIRQQIEQQGFNIEDKDNGPKITKKMSNY